MSSITIFIADRQPKIRTACVDLLRQDKKMHVLGEARSGLEAITGLAKLRPHILLLNFNLLQRKSIPFLQALRLNSPKTKVVLLTRRANETALLRALSYGVRGYLRESLLSTFLTKMVHAVNRGETWVPRKMAAKIVDQLQMLIPMDHEQ